MIINVNYVLAVKNNLLHNSNNKDANQMSMQNAQCKYNAKCDNQSQQQHQLTRQNIQCNISAKCTNYSTSNIVVCQDRALCLIQYEGPFVLSNPY
ncbi:MAG: hypothetical protein M3Z01_00225 [Thermoproteota archaeon]|nr:hypothetical protein [Thermoproteota archaeon]